MKKLLLVSGTLLILGIMSCGETHQTDNATKDPDTMVLKQDQTDSATNGITTDTTKR